MLIDDDSMHIGGVAKARMIKYSWWCVLAGGGCGRRGYYFNFKY